MNLITNETENKLSVRAVAAGTVVTMASILLLMSLASAVGIWNNTFMEFSEGDSNALWAWASLAWAGSAFFGGIVATMVGKPKGASEHFLYGIITWSSSFVAGCFLLTIALGYFGNLSNYSWMGFLSNVLALTLSIIGSMVRWEQQSFTVKRVKQTTFGAVVRAH